MRKLVTSILALAFLAAPLAAQAESGEDEAAIKAIDLNASTITLDNGKAYAAPSEFNYEGLEPGVKVVIYYTTTGDKRVIDDLIVDE